MKKKLKSFIFISLLIICLFSIINVNKKYRGYIVHEYNLNENMSYNNVNTKILDFEIFSVSDFKKQFPKANINNDISHYLVCNISFDNKTELNCQIDLAQLILNSGNWCTYLNIENFLKINNVESYLIDVKSNENTELYLPFVYSDYYFGEITNRNFKLDLLFGYPYINEKNTVILN